MGELYVKQRLSSVEIAEELGCEKSTVLRWLDRHDIEVRDRNSEKYPWHDEKRLREMYFERDMNQYEIADELGCSQVTIAKWFDRHNIETGWVSVDVLHDEDWLRHMYLDKGFSQHEIADKLGCAQMTVSRWCDRHNIETRKANYEKHGSHGFKDGYEIFSSKGERIYIHRLIMVAEEGFDAVKGMDVHHKNEVRWDNRSENLKLMDPAEHISHHRSQD